MDFKQHVQRAHVVEIIHEEPSLPLGSGLVPTQPNDRSIALSLTITGEPDIQNLAR